MSLLFPLGANAREECDRLSMGYLGARW